MRLATGLKYGGQMEKRLSKKLWIINRAMRKGEKNTVLRFVESPLHNSHISHILRVREM